MKIKTEKTRPQGRDKSSPGGVRSPNITENLPFTDGTDQLSDLIHIKQVQFTRRARAYFSLTVHVHISV